MTGFKSKKNSAIAKLLEQHNLPDTPTARAYLSRVLEEDDDTQGYVADKQEPAQESWRGFASDYERGFIDGMQKQAQSSVDKAVNQMAQPAQEPVAWAVQGCSKMWRGEFAEIDAKAEAKRIGGTCVAYALYTTLPKRHMKEQQQ